MPRVLLQRVIEGVTGRGLFKVDQNAANGRGVFSRIRLIAALRILEFGKALNELYETREIGEFTCRVRLYLLIDV